MSMTKGQQTRQRILKSAQASVLAKGFSNTTIDEIRADVGLTKSGFLYHFEDKTALAKALLEQYIKDDDRVFDEIFDRAADLNDDPLHAFLIGLKLLAEAMGNLPVAHPGCMVAAVAYHDKQFNKSIRALNRGALESWRKRFFDMLTASAEQYPPKVDVDLEKLADMLSSSMEGGIVLSRAFDSPEYLADQIMLYRLFVKTIFLGAGKD